MNTLSHDTRGAIYVEFLAAFLPVFIFFQCLYQISRLYVGQLVVQHAAYSAARAAAVVLHDDPAEYDNVGVGSVSGKRKHDIEMAAAIPMRAMNSIVDFEVDFPSAKGASDSRTSYSRDDLVRVRVTAQYRCRVPLANRIACNWYSTLKELKAESAFPNQGADYEY